jgi:hypothetical protein
VASHGWPQSVVLSLPPLGCLWLVPELEDDPDDAAVAADREGTS